jgi:hypothetical protein
MLWQGLTFSVTEESFGDVWQDSNNFRLDQKRKLNMSAVPWTNGIPEKTTLIALGGRSLDNAGTAQCPMCS